MVHAASSVSALRAFTYRLTSTPTQQLPKVAAQVAGSLWNCRDVLSSPSDAKQANDASAATHRFKTHLSTLLQDRSVEGRWSAVVLLKSTIEAGGLEVLAKSNAWVRSLLGILKKPDPPTTRLLVVLTLTRIFMLTWDYSNLVREITTPALATFVPTCISNMENSRCSAQELQAILDAFCALLPRHPTIFRTHESKLRTYLTALLSSKSITEDGVVEHRSEAHEAAARKVLVLLHSCAPKQGAGEKWQETIRAAVLAAHATCDHIFRAVNEDWHSNADVEPSLPQQRILQGNVETEGEDLTGMRPWKGVFAGAERLKSQLNLIECHLHTATPYSVQIRLGLIMDLLTRIFDITVPQAGGSGSVSFNNQIAKEERDALFALLPDVHASAIHLVLTITQRFGLAVLPLVQSVTDQVLTAFRSESWHTDFRLASFTLISSVVEMLGPAMLRHETAEYEAVFRYSCEELLDARKAARKATGSGSSTAISQQLGLDATGVAQSHPTNILQVQQAAAQLLRTTLLRLNSRAISAGLRAQIDRVILLSRSKDALIASVLNPPSKHLGRQPQASLLPILAREFSDTTEVEAILRPRLPTVFIETRLADGASVQDAEGDDSEGDQTQDQDEDDGDAGSILSAVDELMLSAAEVLSTTAVLADEASTAFGKRRALDGEDLVPSAKRVRASLSPDNIAINSRSDVVNDDPMEVPNDVLPTSQENPISKKHIARLSDDIQVANTVQDAGALGGINNAPSPASDDSEFEMPPLTMELDTEDENEE